MKINCWEYLKCQREPGGAKTGEFGICPASTLSDADGFCDGKNAGRGCTFVSGTFCGGVVQGTVEEKAKGCFDCEFYKLMKNEYGTAYNEFTFAKHIRKHKSA